MTARLAARGARGASAAPLAPLLRRAFVIALAAAVAVGAAVAGALALQLRELREAFRQREVARLARSAHSLVTDRESALRGYLLTGRDTLLGPERRARPLVRSALDSMHAFVRDTSQRRRAAAIEDALARWDSAFARRALAAAGGAERAALLADEPLLDKPLFDPVRGSFTEFLRAEDLLYQGSRRRAERAAVVSLLVGLAGLAVLVAVLARLRAGLVAQATELDEQQHRLEEQAVELEVQTVELAGLNEELRDANERLLGAVTETTRVNEELEALSYTMAHDLRAPLRALDGYGYMLEQDYSERLDARGREHVARLRAGSRRLARLIDDLLALARVGRGELRRERVDLGRLARAALEDLRRAEPGRQVELRAADGLEARGDPTLLTLVMQNLVGNAWKFTGGREKAHIEVGIARRDGQSAYFVRDDGAGFDPAYAGRLFGAFQRLHGDEFEGTGIGLAIVHRIVARHGGRAWAESAPGRGATFFFTIPSAGATER